MKNPYSLGELEQAMYHKYSRKLIAEELEPSQATYQNLGSNLLSLERHTDFAVEISANLLILWKKSDLTNRQKLQHMIHPNGIAFGLKSACIEPVGRTPFLLSYPLYQQLMRNKKPDLALQNVLSPAWWAQLESNQ